MVQKTGRCAVCSEIETHGTRLSKVVVEGRGLTLCRMHAATVAAAMPETFEDLRALFAGDGLGKAPPGQKERRSPIDRRNPDDRRVFPPRPEGRRVHGRRSTDPRD